MSTEVVLYGLKMINPPVGSASPGDRVESFPMVVNYTNIGVTSGVADAIRDIASTYYSVLRRINNEVDGLEQFLVLDTRGMQFVIDAEKNRKIRWWDTDFSVLESEIKSNPDLVWWIHIET